MKFLRKWVSICHLWISEKSSTTKLIKVSLNFSNSYLDLSEMQTYKVFPVTGLPYYHTLPNDESFNYYTDD